MVYTQDIHSYVWEPNINNFYRRVKESVMIWYEGEVNVLNMLFKIH